ncbi:MAG: hypothetical protein GWM90_03360, partial [Gemmatimonadetes bacterium]|nr:hypothetical protein [Gemmatimonadota bacterium]NIQ52667.1 hypothetical protein [Gemmatimonadota bacterium]NIU72803.1 hypothetical protein [Gammaproteobacteria bacterium]NIX43192.1 hypothetical protein [Gemmatimonadota bacterium]
LAMDLDEAPAREALGRVPVTLVAGTDDRWAGERADESARRLAELGVRSERVRYAGGHRIEAGVLARHWPL